MMDFASAVAAGLAGEHIKREIFEAREEEWKELVRAFPQKWERLVKSVESLAANAGHSPIYDPINLFSFPSTYQMNLRGRGHSSIFLPAPVSVYALVKQVGFITLACKAGWNTLDLTDGSELALAAGVAGSQGALILYADVNLGDAVGVL